MRKILPIMLLTLFCSTYMYGQNQQQYNHFIANQGLLNPAYNGTRDYLSGLIIHRSQWVGVEGAPNTQALNVHSPLGKTNLGLGLNVVNEQIGSTHTLDFLAAASYKINFDRNKYLSFGVNIGLNTFAIDESEIVTTDASDGALYGVSTLGFNSGVGAYYYSEKFFVGVSVPEFFTNDFSSSGGEYTSAFIGKNIHTYVYGGYVFELDKVSIKPTLLTRFVHGAPIQLDFSTSVLFMEKFWLGLEYRTPADLVFLAEYMINRQFTVRYSYDYPFSSLNELNNGGSHEIGLQFDLSFGRATMPSIRYF